jgi:hypothetical protein
MNRWQIHLTRESVKHADQLFFSLCFLLFPTEFLEAYVFRNSYICNAPGILGIDMRKPRHLLLTLSVKYSCHKNHNNLIIAIHLLNSNHAQDSGKT